MAHPDDQARIDALERRLATLEEGRNAPSRWRYLLVAAGVLALTVTGVATGVTGDTLKEGQRNPSSGFASKETELAGGLGGYTARLSNYLPGDGGAQVSGCRASAANEPCLYVANLNSGKAFHFFSKGAKAGEIELLDPAGAPFTTNATGVATGLNADKVDGKDASELETTAYESGDNFQNSVELPATSGGASYLALSRVVGAPGGLIYSCRLWLSEDLVVDPPPGDDILLDDVTMAIPADPFEPSIGEATLTATFTVPPGTGAHALYVRCFRSDPTGGGGDGDATDEVNVRTAAIRVGSVATTPGPDPTP